MRLRDDIDIAQTWVTSDTHYGHENIVAYCNRPEDHDQVMLAEWRKVALPGRTMLHIGDLSYKGNAWFKHIIAKELTGPGTADRNLLVTGNHDKSPYKFYKDSGFKLARPFALRLVNYGRGLEVFDPAAGLSLPSTHWTVSFSHYPWSEAEDGPQGDRDWRVHGHIHNNGYYDGRSNAGGPDDQLVPYLRNHINVSVEVLNYKPVNLKSLLDGAILGLLPDQGGQP